MKVYRINFPCGHFYIGCTKQPIIERLKNHLVHSSTKVGAFIEERNLCLEELQDFTSVIYEGDRSLFEERAAIYANRDNFLMLNEAIPKVEPKFSTWLNQQTKVKKQHGHIAVFKDTKEKFDDLCRIKGMTQDGLIRHLMERM